MPDRLSLASLASVPSDVAKPAYDPAQRQGRHPSPGPRRLSSRAPGGVHRRRARKRSALGHLRRFAQDAARDRAAGRAGRPLHVPRAHQRRRRRARDRRRARHGVRGNVARCAGRAVRRSGGHDRVVDRHGERLLPRSGDRRAQRIAPRHRARPRVSRRAGVGDRHRRRGPCRAACGGRGQARVRLLRQPAAQRSDGGRTRACVRAAARRLACALDRGQRDVSVDDGRPHRAGNHRRRHRRGAAQAGRSRRGAGDRRAVCAMGDRGPYPRAAAARGKTRARSSCTTSRRSSS